MKETAKAAARQADAGRTAAEQAVEATNAAAVTVREFAERGAQQVKATYDRFRTVAEETTNVLEETYATVAKGYAQVSLKTIEAAQENANAAFELARNLVSAKSFTEAFEAQTAYAQRRFDARVAQAKEFAALVGTVANDSVRPVREGFEKSAAQWKQAV